MPDKKREAKAIAKSEVNSNKSLSSSDSTENYLTNEQVWFMLNAANQNAKIEKNKK